MLKIHKRMKSTGIIFDIKRFALQDGPGIRTTVFLKGCPLRCIWCHNPESQEAQPEPRGDFQSKTSSLFIKKNPDQIGSHVTVDEVMDEVRKDILFYEESSGGVTFSGGEPLLQENFLFGLLHRCKADGIHTAVDTCGYAEYWIFKKINSLVDMYLYDLKINDENLHFKYTGVSNQIIKNNLKSLVTDHENVIVRIPLIPDVVVNELNLEKIAQFLTSLNYTPPVEFLPYNKFGEGKYKKLQRKKLFPVADSSSSMNIDDVVSLFESFGIAVIKEGA